VDFYETPKTFYVVLELARGGDVFDRLSKRTVYTEQDARKLGCNLVTAISTMHQLNIVHRDLKPENLLLVETKNDSFIKLADFGFSKKIPSSDYLTTRCGTPAFVAPEILIGSPYRTTVDMWSCGVILYLLLGGYPPFQGENHKALFRKIRAADYVFHDKYWEHISIHAKQLIAQMLTVDPQSRITAQHAMVNHPWLTDNESDVDSLDMYSSTDLSTTLDQIRKFNARRKLKGVMQAVTYATSAKFWNSDTVSFMTRDTTAIQSQAFSAVSTKQKIADKFGKTKGRILTGGKAGKTFRDIYQLDSKLRKGIFATVWSGKHITSGVPKAIKVIHRAKLTPKDDAAVMNEVAILQSLRHAHIVPLHDFFEERDYFYMVMEMMDGGDVFDRIVQRTHYTEKNARDLCIALLNAVLYIHQRGVAHRDLKPQNLLLARRDDDSYIKVADFGFAKRVHTPKSLTTRCGTPTYVAPEILKNHPHDETSDLWSVGVIIYVLLVGYPPFMEDNQKLLFRKIRSGDFNFFPEDWQGVSSQVQDLISKLLVVDTSHRWTAAQALQHEWVVGVSEHDLSSNDLSEGIGEMRELLKASRVTETEASPFSANYNLPNN